MGSSLVCSYRRVEQRSPGVLVIHTPIQLFVLGDDRLERKMLNDSLPSPRAQITARSWTGLDHLCEGAGECERLPRRHDSTGVGDDGSGVTDVRNHTRHCTAHRFAHDIGKAFAVR